MKIRSVFLCVGCLGFILLAACNDKETPYRPSPPKPPEYPDLLHDKDEVFKYLEMVWEYRAAHRYPKLLDDDFVFYFGADDVHSGAVPDTFWNRTQELTAAENLFEGKVHPIYGAVTSISLTLLPEGPWIELQQTEPPYAGEIWYRRTVEYSIIVQTTASYTLMSRDVKALFTVRWAETEADSIWRLVRWYDDVGG